MRIQSLAKALGPLAAAAALVLAAVVPAAAEAGAASAPPARAVADCPLGSVCFWSQPDFTGDMRTAQYRQHDCETVPFGTARSIVNNSDETLTFFAEARCKVPVGGLEPGGRVHSVSVSSWQ
ncbi:peptidase inhibitor family I36 protein [Streptomyces sp. NPDC001793]|uniref:peptidase inhibitor family I36 protein n=1 Tax=Streptomyces sp. NPDC001793 TaxID=3154657 RepID=UPI003319A297